MTRIQNGDLSGVLPLEEIKKRFNEFKSLFQSGALKDIMTKFYFENVGLSTSAIKQRSPEEFNTIKVFRVRKNIDEERERNVLISTFSYPPPILTNSNGRANLAGYPVFYGALSKNAAMFEAKLKPGDYFYFTEWSVNVDRQVTISNILHQDLPVENPLYTANKNIASEIENQVSKISPDKTQQFMFIMNEWANLFTSESFPYSLSSWFAYTTLYEGMEPYIIDAIIYPSTETKHTGNCIVFHPNFVDQYFKLTKIFKCQCRNSNSEKHDFGIGYIGEIKNGNINWRRATEEEGQYFDVH